MQVTELRIGSLLLLDNEPVKINGIIPFDGIWVLKVKKGDKYLSSSGQDLEPISLTEEWLMKFGFEKRSNYWRLNKEHEFELLYNDVIGYRFAVEGQYGYPEIKYVHQLQNLYFALAGTEL